MRRPALLQSMQKCTTVLQNPWAESFTKILIFVHRFRILCFAVKPMPWRRLGSRLKSPLSVAPCTVLHYPEWSVSELVVARARGQKPHCTISPRGVQRQKTKYHKHDKQRSRQSNDSGTSRKRETRSYDVHLYVLEIYKSKKQTGYQP